MAPLFQFADIQSRHFQSLVADQLGGGEFVDLIQKGPFRIYFCNKKIAGCAVNRRYSITVPCIDNRHQVVVPCLVQRLGAGDGSRCDDADHLPLYDPLGGLWILHLLGDGHLIALLHQAGQVAFHRMIGNAAHGGPLRKPAVLTGQRQLQLLGGGLRVLEKHLVKIPETVKQDTVFVLLFRLQVLGHHW